MDEQQIDALESGHYIDWLAQHYVMYGFPANLPPLEGNPPRWDYSRDIRAAWLLANEISDRKHPSKSAAEVSAIYHRFVELFNQAMPWALRDEDAALVITRCALKAVLLG